MPLDLSSSDELEILGSATLEPTGESVAPGLDDLPSAAPAAPAVSRLQNPPADHRLVAGPPYDMYEDLAADLAVWARAQGFYFAVRRRRKPRNGIPTKV